MQTITSLDVPIMCLMIPAQDAAGLLCCQGALLAHIPHHSPQALPTDLLPPASPSPSLYLCQQLFLLTSRTSHLSLLNFIRFLWVHPSSPPRYLWMTSLPSRALSGPPSLVSSTNLMRVYFVTCSRSLIKMLNRTGPRADPHCVAIVTGILAEYDPLTTTLQA